MQLPNQTDIEALYTQYNTPQHIQDHMSAVASIATQMGESINATAGTQRVECSLLEAASLLHDLVRIPEQWQYLPDTIPTPQSHAEINYLILKEAYPEVAETVRPHSLMTIFNAAALSTLEQKIVFYADKRVNHSTVVSLHERIALGKARWGVTPETDNTPELLPKLDALEEELFSSLTISPEELHANSQPNVQT